MNIITADGKKHLLEGGTEIQLLSNCLENCGFPLNTRCGGRGLCRGCQVIADGVLMRACQNSTEGLEEVEIPNASLQDSGLSGVSLFELNADLLPPSDRKGFAIAVDVGTTTIAAALWRLEDGICLSSGSATNAQRTLGDDVLTRIDHAISRGGTSPELKIRLIRKSLDPLLKGICQEAGVEINEISEVLVGGNAIMLHSLTGDSLAGFGAYPFSPVFLDSVLIEGKELGSRFSCNWRLTPSLGPFVGADISLGVLATEMMTDSYPSLLIDFGTNGELFLHTPTGNLATATALGPAFEGGRLRCGATARKGVVTSLLLNEGEWNTKIEGGQDAVARGISGTAYVDFIAQAKKEGWINSLGRFTSDAPIQRDQDEDGDDFRLIQITGDQFVAETDVAELVQAKAAIGAGILTLLEEADLEITDLGKVYVAGSFGFYLNLSNAAAIGLVPDIGEDKIQVMGNSSLGGASLCLLSDCDPKLQELKASTQVLELNQCDGFEDNFIDAMALQPLSELA